MKALRPAHWIIIVIAATLIAFISWAQWAELDQVTRAPGRVVPFARVQIVQSEEGGAISAISVREGDMVQQGDLLVELDTVQLAAGVEEARAQVAALQSRMARIDAELFNKPLSFPASLAGFPEFTANQRQLFMRRQAAHAAELRALSNMAELQQEELDLNQPLVSTGDVAQSEIIRMERAIVETQGRISNIQAQYVRDLQTEFTQTEEELVAAQQQLTQREDSLRAASLVAPTDGIVKNVRLTTVGGVLRPGDEVLQIVPTGEQLIVEAQVPPRDIAFVQLGQRARVNFDAYDSAVYGSGDGEVVYISPDTLSEERDDGTVNTYYRVNLEVSTDTMNPRNAGETIDLQPGMTATAEILTGSQTVWEYITKPILKTTRQSLQER
ncbi:HlyD family efflux transporter periplasmic adaptor subunit [Aurantiacibacter poecillastricola]|uniref:HlyD family efflux transporter periplasmic adaptor subunit n=1 Tax=Aurantiacibacter poecillastricola TaxID=3064385 RepID=UPI00273F81D8|nr:HlyD family efflux transporter periplasmic adaptor subunit [Aurantiacibacter sp. 219JJ12-13]MDP5261403.1 HlyD family efflux transporter periplasmic adaptor subunit [Aurantiacibacter sp. 219JJ12-13]